MAITDQHMARIAELEAANEELIRGMTEMGQRFTAAMQGAAGQITGMRARCAAEAERAVTRFYAEQLHQQGENLEGYVKRMVLEVPGPATTQ